MVSIHNIHQHLSQNGRNTTSKLSTSLLMPPYIFVITLISSHFPFVQCRSNCRIIVVNQIGKVYGICYWFKKASAICECERSKEDADIRGLKIGSPLRLLEGLLRRKYAAVENASFADFPGNHQLC
jgi:hypothetical protein